MTISSRWIRRSVTGALEAVAVTLLLSACGGGGNDTGTGSASSPGPSAAAPKCGLGNGQKATGSPIKIGAIVTKQPGIDFTDGPNMAKAFFACVNDNGGINGRPVKYLIQTEQTNPVQVRGLARKLIESDNVDLIVGDFSIIDCSVNHTYWEAKGFYVLDAGVAAECYGTSHSAPANMGPRYSADGAAQALFKQGIKKLVLDTPNVPGADYIISGPAALAKAAGIPYVSVKDTAPVQDANSVALKLVQAAGQGGGVVINNTPGEALKIFQAAERQHIADRVKWGCSTSCNTDFLAEALGPAWNGKLFVNAELSLVDAPGRDNELYRQVREKYAPKIAIGSYGQMGFLLAKIATDRLLTVKGDITTETANQAVLQTKDYKTDLLCKPWYYQKAPLHIPNNTDRTVVPKDGHMVQQEDCFDISADDPDIARVRQLEKTQGTS